MWRFLAGAVAALLVVAVGVLIFNARATSDSALPARPALASGGGAQADAQMLPDSVPEASDRTREQKRFDRYDKDRDGKVTRDEYLLARHKAFAKLDVNGDGRLSFDEWATKAETKFAAADADHSGAMNPDEFAATAVKRKPARRPNCAPASTQPAPDEEQS